MRAPLLTESMHARSRAGWLAAAGCQPLAGACQRPQTPSSLPGCTHAVTVAWKYSKCDIYVPRQVKQCKISAIQG